MVDSLIEAVHGEMPPRGPERRKWFWWKSGTAVVVSLVAAWTGIYFGFLADDLTAERHAKRDNDVAERLDKEVPPFDASVVEDWNRRRPIGYVLDRRLTEDERGKLADSTGTGYVRSLGARPVRGCGEGEGCGTVQYFMKMSSQKAQDQIDIVDLTVRKLRCTEPATQTLFSLPSGESNRPTPLYVNLTSAKSPQFMVKDVENGGTAPFSEMGGGGDTVGGGALPSKFIIDVDSARTCTWRIGVTYLPNGRLDDFEYGEVPTDLRGDSLPVDPDEHWSNGDGHWKRAN
ncbi:hypothetical protein ACFV6E_13315 [Streptomyces sp. NPDC059785]|uniref:hypothetical protein n=1 Tax=Streptomyces sp. NPDC059785 TaxID=3346945 RepID=UPI00364B2263